MGLRGVGGSKANEKNGQRLGQRGSTEREFQSQPMIPSPFGTLFLAWPSPPLAPWGPSCVITEGFKTRRVLKMVVPLL